MKFLILVSLLLVIIKSEWSDVWYIEEEDCLYLKYPSLSYINQFDSFWSYTKDYKLEVFWEDSAIKVTQVLKQHVITSDKTTISESLIPDSDTTIQSEPTDTLAQDENPGISIFYFNECEISLHDLHQKTVIKLKCERPLDEYNDEILIIEIFFDDKKTRNLKYYEHFSVLNDYLVVARSIFEPEPYDEDIIIKPVKAKKYFIPISLNSSTKKQQTKSLENISKDDSQTDQRVTMAQSAPSRRLTSRMYPKMLVRSAKSFFSRGKQKQG
jgi:hypothetical protein